MKKLTIAAAWIPAPVRDLILLWVSILLLVSLAVFLCYLFFTRKKGGSPDKDDAWHL